eukprot:TRINITY_DN11884_c0_g2_i2.p1 TRINITY_DN11884_c0_g2~~TRINITY_DN11884_c0_g2_i2.p1  ORF type:complete len:374 (+),score=75.55 TRINITY_DN11884_c0_g2_i2:60-1181(+)
MGQLDHSRAISEASVLTEECSRCVAEDAAAGLEFYGSRYGVQKELRRMGTEPRSVSHSQVTTPVSQGSPGHESEETDETGWRHLVQAVRENWGEARESGTVPQVVPSVDRPAARVPGRVHHEVPVGNPPPPPPPPQPVRHGSGSGSSEGERGDYRAGEEYRGAYGRDVPPLGVAPRVAPHAGGASGVRARVGGRQPQQGPPQRAASRGAYRATARGDDDPRRPAYDEPRECMRRSTSHASSARDRAPAPVADAAGLQRRIMTLQRTVSTLKDDRSKLETHKRSLQEENEQYRRAIHSKDQRLCKLNALKNQITKLTVLDRKGAQIHSQRQQTLNGLEAEIKNLFSDWQETRINPRNKSSMAKCSAAPKAVWQY